MRKVISTFLVLIIIMSHVNVYADNGIDVYFNDLKLNLKNKPFKDGGDVYLPLRDVMEGQGKVVIWNNDTKEVVVTGGNQLLVMKANSNKVKCNGVNINLTKPVKIVKGVTYIPSELFNKCLNYGVIDNGDINIYSYFNVYDVKQEGVYTKKDLTKNDVAKLNKTIKEIEKKYGKKLIEEDYIDSSVIDVFYSYTNEVLSKDNLEKGINWDDHFGVVIDKPTLDFYTQWKALAPLSDIYSRFVPVVYYRVNEKDFIVGGYEDYSGSEKNLNKSLTNYKSSFERFYGENLSKRAEEVVKDRLRTIINIINKGRDFKVIEVKNDKINGIY